MGVSHRTQASTHSGITCSLTSGLSSFLGVLAVHGAQSYGVVGSVPSNWSHSEYLYITLSLKTPTCPPQHRLCLWHLAHPDVGGYRNWVELANTHPVVSIIQALPGPLCSKRPKFTSKSPPLEEQFRMVFPNPCPSSISQETPELNGWPRDRL